jgi:hypothetical protein
VNLDASADDPGAEDVIGGTDDAGTHGDDDGSLAKGTGEGEGNGDRDPYNRRAHEGNHGTEAGNDAPDNGRGKAEEEKQESGHGALDEGDGANAIEVGEDALADLADKAIKHVLIEREHFAGLAEEAAAVAEKEEQDEQDDDAVEQEQGNVTDDALDAAQEGGRDDLDALGEEDADPFLGVNGIDAVVDKRPGAGVGDPFDPAPVGVGAVLEGGVGGAHLAGHGRDDPDRGDDDEGDDKQEREGGGDARPAGHAAEEGGVNGVEENGEGAGGNDGADEGFCDDVADGQRASGEHEEEELLEVAAIDHSMRDSGEHFHGWFV